MKRIQDKIKDLVEPQVFEQIGNFSDDPARALAAYRFTDVTSDLLSRWLDVLAGLKRGSGAALALAGARGVGKSHTLAVFGALAGSERLRSTVEDAHVSASALRLSGRRHAVVRVGRGTRPTLAEELAAGFASVFGGSEGQWVGNPAEILSVAASRAGEETLVVIIDTAFNRPARVARDDGPWLGDLAVTARGLNAFLAVALDDDIAGADGVNVALSGAYQIDYLDPENLFRVAEQFVLRKKPQGRAAIRDIYQSLRASVRNFNWSESRFASLYPVHPLVAEVAAGVRMFAPTFAFLPFAAGAAVRASGRPAQSLVLLDEVFDAAEAELRRSQDLREAFSAYDYLTGRCINELPVMRRYQARLILKSLFVLSLDSRGATPGELCSALLMSESAAGSGDAPGQIEETLASFADAATAGSIYRSVVAGGEKRYGFRIPVLDAYEAAREGTAAEPEPKAEEAGELVVGAQKAEATAQPPTESAAADSPAAVRDEGGAVEESVAAAEAEGERGGEELTAWARLLTDNASLAPLSAPGGREGVVAALSAWLEAWRARDMPAKFDALPDEALTTRIWKAAEAVRRSFGRAVEAVESAVAGQLSLEDCLGRVADAFRNSAETFTERARLLEDLTELAEGFALREAVRAYLATAEPTGVGEIETARRELLSIADGVNNFLDAARRARFDRLWREFRARYAEHYAAEHDKTVGAGADEGLRELLRGERWREFESLSRLPVVSTKVWRQAEELARDAAAARCDLPVRQLLESRPSCACRFRLGAARELERLPAELEAMAGRGLEVYRRTLLMLGGHLAIALDALARKGSEGDDGLRARSLSTSFAQGRLPERLARADVRLIERALGRMAAPPPVRVTAPNGDAGLLTREELRARFEQWLDELPEQPVLIEVVSKRETV